MLQVTVSNLPNIKNQLFQLYVEITTILHDLMPEEDNEMPLLEDFTDEGSDNDLATLTI